MINNEPKSFDGFLESRIEKDSLLHNFWKIKSLVGFTKICSFASKNVLK